MGHLMFWKLVVTVFAFLVAVKIVSAAFQFLLGDAYPAWTMIVALVIVSRLYFYSGGTSLPERRDIVCFGPLQDLALTRYPDRT